MAVITFIEIRDGIEIYRKGRTLISYERFHEFDKEQCVRGLQRVLKINPAIEAENVRRERERNSKSSV